MKKKKKQLSSTNIVVFRYKQTNYLVSLQMCYNFWTTKAKLELEARKKLMYIKQNKNTFLI